MPEQSTDDPRAIVGRLYDEHGASLYRYAVMVLADAAGAEDAVQQVFSALLKPGAMARVLDAPAYLRRAVRNECYSMLRLRKSEGMPSASPLFEAIDETIVDPGERMTLERAVRTLPPEQREVIHLHVFDGMTFQEIANASDESINTVAGRYRYALQKLRDYFGRAR